MKGRYFIDKQASIRRFNQMAAAHNDQFYARNDKNERVLKWNGSELIRKTHFDVYEVLLYLLIRKNNPQELTDITDLCSVSTSRQEILNLYSQRLSETDPYRPVSPSKETVWRLLRRLTAAGIVQKRNIKGSSLFRLTLSVKSLEIFNLETRLPLSQETPSESAVSPENIAKFQLYQSSTKEEKGKNNAHAVDKAESGQKPDDLKKTENGKETGNTGKVVENQGGAPHDPPTFFGQQEKISQLAKEEPDRYKRTRYQVERHKYKAVLETYKLILSQVFSEKKVRFESYGEILNHPFTFALNLPKLNLFAEHNTALTTLLSYFATAKTYQDVDLTQRRLMKAVGLARRNILRQKFNTDYLTPSKFLKRGKVSLLNVLEQWLPKYMEREALRIRKIENDQTNLAQSRLRTQFFTEADLLLAEIGKGYSIADAFRYISEFYPATYENWFEELLALKLEGQYTHKIRRRTKAQEEWLDKIFNTEAYIELNQDKLLRDLNGYMKKRTYTNAMASAVAFKDPMVRANAVGIRDQAFFNDFAYRKLLFN